MNFSTAWNVRIQLWVNWKQATYLCSLCPCEKQGHPVWRVCTFQPCNNGHFPRALAIYYALYQGRLSSSGGTSSAFPFPFAEDGITSALAICTSPSLSIFAQNLKLSSSRVRRASRRDGMALFVNAVSKPVTRAQTLFFRWRTDHTQWLIRQNP